MTTELKLCKDCKHSRKQKLLDFSKLPLMCSRFPSGIDLDRGIHTLYYSGTVRQIYGDCGKEAKGFVQNTSLWYKLKNIFRKPL